MDALRLAASAEAQRAYATRVPIADVTAEVFCVWEDVYTPDIDPHEKAFSADERTALAAYEERSPRGRKPQDAGEVLVEGDERAPFRAGDLDQGLVRRAAEALRDHCGHVATAVSEDLRPARAEILVQLDLHEGLMPCAPSAPASSRSHRRRRHGCPPT